MDYVNSRDFVSNGDGFTASWEQIKYANQQFISKKMFCNLLGEADKEDDIKDHQVDNIIKLRMSTLGLTFLKP